MFELTLLSHNKDRLSYDNYCRYFTHMYPLNLPWKISNKIRNNSRINSHKTKPTLSYHQDFVIFASFFLLTVIFYNAFHISDFMSFYSYIIHNVSLKIIGIFYITTKPFITPHKINNNSWNHNTQRIIKIPWLSQKVFLHFFC